MTTTSPTRQLPGLVPVGQVGTAFGPGATGTADRHRRAPVADGPVASAPSSADPPRPSVTVLVAVASGLVALLAFTALAAAAFAAASLPGVVILLSGSMLGATAFLTATAVLAAPTGAPGRQPVVASGDAARELARLVEVNRVLGVLAELSRSLPTNQDLDEVLVAIRARLIDTLGAQRLAILTLDDDRWYPQLAEGLDLGPAGVLDDLPAPMDAALLEPSVLRVDDLSAVCDRTGSGLYARLVVDGMDEGLLAIEHERLHRFDDRSVELFEGVCELVALGIENARSFARLRSLAAAEERARIARDLHDRLGQWLTYINLELERINGSLQPPDPELDRLQGDVRSAIDELRDALVELRTTIRAERPLALVLPEVVRRFSERTRLTVELSVPDPSASRLSGVVENELLRIVQESLTNIEKHADATVVHINWSVDGGRGILTIEDNGRGFDPARGIRSTAYGLVGMRERAAAVGAILEIASQRGTGTVVTVLVGPPTEESRP